jgi:uncharacterized protein involved in exopolysaccharide biosynthesis
MNEVTIGATPPTARSVVKTYWRLPVIAVLAGLLAYIGSFVVSPTYASGTRVLVRGKDSTLLSASGSRLSNQPNLIDSQLAAVLSSTNAALVSSNDIAERVVDELHLDVEKPKPSGVFGHTRRFFAGTYKRSRAILTHGFYKKPGPREAAIQGVQSGLKAKAVKDSYVLEVLAAADNPDLAAKIANSAADQLVAVNSRRASSEADAYRDFLRKEVEKATKAGADASRAVASFKAANGIADATGAKISSDQAEQLRREISTTSADLTAAQAKAAELSAQLASTSPTAETNNRITTGRSQTDVSARSPNPAYTAALNTSQQATAEVTRLSARLTALRELLARADASFATGPITSIDEKLQRLQLDSSLADKTLADLNQRYQDALVNSESSSVELTRLDRALAPTYPIGPKRYLYLGIGLFCGALVGFVWSHLRAARRRARQETHQAAQHGHDVLPMHEAESATNGKATAPQAETAPMHPVGARVGSPTNGVIDLTAEDRLPPIP